MCCFLIIAVLTDIKWYVAVFTWISLRIHIAKHIFVSLWSFVHLLWRNVNWSPSPTFKIVSPSFSETCLTNKKLHKVCSMMFWYTYTWWNNYNQDNTSVTSSNYQFFCVRGESTEDYCSTNFKQTVALLLGIVITADLRSAEHLHLMVEHLNSCSKISPFSPLLQS